jgi:hypothetical protein
MAALKQVFFLEKVIPMQSSSALCESCRFVAYLLHNLWGDEALEDCAFDFVVFLCTELQIIGDNFVCQAMVSTLKVP